MTQNFMSELTIACILTFIVFSGFRSNTTSFYIGHYYITGLHKYVYYKLQNTALYLT